MKKLITILAIMGTGITSVAQDQVIKFKEGVVTNLTELGQYESVSCAGVRTERLAQKDRIVETLNVVVTLKNGEAKALATVISVQSGSVQHFSGVSNMHHKANSHAVLSVEFGNDGNDGSGPQYLSVGSGEFAIGSDNFQIRSCSIKKK